ncbi:Uncharacterised protein [Mycobacterium tuberculosis]|nr:Uncharacterised protein [Mycobacterium tuberculosis]
MALLKSQSFKPMPRMMATKKTRLMPSQMGS